MEWNSVANDWGSASRRLVKRFPGLDAKALATPPARLEALAEMVAEAQDMTLFEAREEVEDVLFGEWVPYRLSRMSG
ncbi:hypothetical protein AL036_16295 [Salipiger aestuarii]|uniref:Uncharacterized protein n=1 Tax=Salipiger aestuarii TaxID=568098 RepID=A0A327XNK8_9RHOB|nr:hypothetical protein [Salipiger aestuarii]EIE51628.1 hypothetical protein C357_07676 [Citreicella sp. 357]KAA8606010.1 hypothetical protein AL036_16295 [Salipiger aestuarii]KAA8607435.1 hypothetical protein AL037_18855 [Salipiger aestuarii]KAB2536930.1 hypothetical protein AL035_19655 [Salipiger aestuarii]RAK10410.1 hypothetical protein ATI53_105812 [Salipiger aestuarii]